MSKQISSPKLKSFRERELWESGSTVITNEASIHMDIINGNPHGTDHDQLGDIKVLDPSDTDIVQNKHLSNSQSKVWQDHVEVIDGNPHGTNHSQLDELLADDHPQYLLLAGRTGQTVTTPLILGTATDNTTIETDGTVKLNGSATTFDDMLFEIVAQSESVYADSGSLGTMADAATSTGSYLDTRARNGVYWKIEEGIGTADDLISLTAPLVFNDVEQPPTMFWSGIYNGSDAHAATMSWIVYNNVTTVWDSLTYTFANALMVDDAIVTGFTAQHINASKQVKVALLHTATGIASHYFWLDEIRLTQDNVPKRVYYKGSFIESFRNTGYDMAHGKVQFRHAYKLASDFYWHVHFVNHVGTIADGETVIFTLSKSFAALYSIFPTEDTLTATFTNNSAWRATLTAGQSTALLTGTTVKIDAHLVAAGASAISGTGLNISSIGLLELKRTAGTYTGDVGILYSDFHIEQDTMGSRTEFSKG